MNWIECGTPWGDFEAKAGMLVEFSDGITMLVGEINEQGGGCNCCGVNKQAVVVRYAIVWEKPE